VTASHAPTGHTWTAAVIGDPIRHSRSPEIFNAAFAEAGLDWVYVALEVADGAAPAALEAMRVLGIVGLSVTMPHKTAVADHLGDSGAHEGDGLTDEARALRAVNCVVSRDGALMGHNTDGLGFVASLRADAGFEPLGSRCVVIGAGGAARALVLALSRAGASEVAVVNRSAGRAEAAAALAGQAGVVAGADAIQHADLVVNATPVGMDGTSVPIETRHIHAGQLVADIIVEPVETPLLVAAASRGARTMGGLGMLAHQAAISFELWTGQPAPVETMVRAARRH
jgi:shikimate dehydrogenase